MLDYHTLFYLSGPLFKVMCHVCILCPDSLHITVIRQQDGTGSGPFGRLQSGKSKTVDGHKRKIMIAELEKKRQLDVYWSKPSSCHVPATFPSPAIHPSTLLLLLPHPATPVLFSCCYAMPVPTSYSSNMLFVCSLCFLSWCYRSASQSSPSYTEGASCLGHLFSLTWRNRSQLVLSKVRCLSAASRILASWLSVERDLAPPPHVTQHGRSWWHGQCRR